MYAFTSSTVYPSRIAIPEPYLDLLDRFFYIVDSCVNISPSESQKFGDVFSEGGVWKTPSAVFQGRDELMNSGTTWPYFATPKKFGHSITEIYGQDVEGKNFMLMGLIKRTGVDGMYEEYPFSAKVEIEDDGKGPRIKWFQGWSSGF